MTRISDYIQVGNRPVIFSPRVTKTAVVLIALAALASLIYYLHRRGLSPNDRTPPRRDPEPIQPAAPNNTTPPRRDPEPIQPAAPNNTTPPRRDPGPSPIERNLGPIQHAASNPAVQRILANFIQPPKGLGHADLLALAQDLESIRSRTGAPNESTRYQVKIFSARFFFETKKNKFIVEVKSDTLRVQYIAAILGRGSFGKVVRLIDLHTGAETALKIATPRKKYKDDQDHKAQAREDLEKEHRNLMIVHTNRHVEPKGVQDKPLSLVLTITKLYDSRVKAHLAYEGTLYAGDLADLEPWELEIKVRLYIALQVLQGMKTCIANKLICHDLKLENILYRESQNPDEPVVHVADLGGATREGELKQELKNGGLVYTPAYADMKRLKRAQKAKPGFGQRKLVRDSEKHSISLTIFAILTGYLPDKEHTLRDLWTEADLPLEEKYEELLTALERCSSSHTWIDSIFHTNISELKKSVKALLKPTA